MSYECPLVNIVMASQIFFLEIKTVQFVHSFSLNKKIKTNIYLVSLEMFKLSAVKASRNQDFLLIEFWVLRRCIFGHPYGFQRKRNFIYFKSK